MTPKEYKKQSTELMHTRNRALVAQATKKILTYQDLFTMLGLSLDKTSAQWNKPLDRQGIFDYFKPFQDKLDAERDGQVVTPVIVAPTPASVDTPILQHDEQLTPEETLPPSAKQKCQLFPFQERAAAKLYHGIVEKHSPAQLLRAAVGTGKTYIVGAVARRLLDIKYCNGKTFSPWPMLYVTKATIVKQTERVFQKEFGIDVVNELKVINIEQLRTALGELMVRCENVIRHGEEHIEWTWREGIHPIIFFFDECQILKNEDSQQAKLVTALHKLAHPHIHCIFFSATPFMRVTDCKCIALNARMEVKGMFDTN